MGNELIMGIAVIVVFGLLVLVHEFGHFITAKMTGMRVDEFAIGFGTKLFGFQKGETYYSLRLIPLGGYNKIAGMESDDDEGAGARAYSKKSVWQRMIVIVAGAMMNILLAYVLLVGVFLWRGIQTPIETATFGQVVVNKPAYQAGLRSGDTVVALDGKDISTWNEFAATVRDSGGKVLKVTYKRDGALHQTLMIPEYDSKAGHALCGVTEAFKSQPVGFFTAWYLAAKQLFFIVHMMVDTLIKMIFGAAHAQIAGPIGVVTVIGQAAEMGLLPLLNITILLSVNLGIINLLPVPALDGGHFFTLCIEALRGKPLSPKMVRRSQYVGMSLLLLLMIFATFQDITRLIG